MYLSLVSNFIIDPTALVSAGLVLPYTVTVMALGTGTAVLNLQVQGSSRVLQIPLILGTSSLVMVSFYFIAISLFLSLLFSLFQPSIFLFFLIGASMYCVHGFVDGSTCRCEEQWTGVDCNTRMLNKKRKEARRC